MFEKIETKSIMTIEELKEMTGVDVQLKSILFQSKEEAEDYLKDIVSEDKAIFVKFLSLVEDVEETKALSELKERLDEEETSLKEFPLNILQKIKDQTSATKGCKHCKSSINKDYLVKNIESKELLSVEDFNCPICEDPSYILNSTDEKRLTNILKRIESIKTKINDKSRKSFEKAKKVEVGLIGLISNENV